MTSIDVDEVQTLTREKGKAYVRREKFDGAITFYYARTIGINPQNCPLYNNRFNGFLKMQQCLGFALGDPVLTIKLEPDLTKSCCRKTGTELHEFRFSEALHSYRKALSLHPHKRSLLDPPDPWRPRTELPGPW